MDGKDQLDLAKILVSPPWMWFAYRVLVIISGAIIGVVSIWLGYELIKQGATGNFTIGAEREGIKAFLSSVSPGLLLVLFGCSVSALSMIVQIKAWGVQNPKQINERNKSGYYPWADK